jgi:DNA-binding transcriptional ArsR family regulator
MIEEFKMIPENQPATLCIIDDLETMKVISDPLRLNILEMVREINRQGSPVSVKRLAEELGIPQGKLYYHVRLLEQHQLLQVADTRVVSGILEKLYRTSALRYVVSNELLTSAEARGESIFSAFSGLFNSVLADVQQSLQNLSEEALQQRIGISRYTLHLQEQQVDEFNQRVAQLMEGFAEQTANQDRETTQSYRAVFALYPIASKSQPHAKEEKDG